MDDFVSAAADAARYILPALGAIVLVYCAAALLRHRFPSPEYAALVEQKTGEVHELTHWEISLGRSTACDVVIEGDLSVSRFHAVIARWRKGWTVIDTYSKTGTFVNGRRIEGKTILENGDTLTFGSATYRFRL
ncbi:MAG: FHA domain-containing protein [Clostridia bacterium]|nr:FHA domain-containing protein [Clostridia bacterium]